MTPGDNTKTTPARRGARRKTDKQDNKRAAAAAIGENGKEELELNDDPVCEYTDSAAEAEKDDDTEEQGSMRQQRVLLQKSSTRISNRTNRRRLPTRN